MQHRSINPTDEWSYAQAHEATGASRLPFMSGQIPESSYGAVPHDFRAQCRLAGANVERQLHDAGVSPDDLVKVTIFARIDDEASLLEIEAVAVTQQ